MTDDEGGEGGGQRKAGAIAQMRRFRLEIRNLERWNDQLKRKYKSEVQKRKSQAGLVNCYVCKKLLSTDGA